MFELPAEAVEPEFVWLFDYWRRKAPPGRLPGRQHIDPVELPPSILPRILLFDVDRSGSELRFRFRVAGTGFIELHGKEVTGQYLDEIGPRERTSPVIAALRTIAETRRPVFLAGSLTLASQELGWIKRLGLPLAEDGETVDKIIVSFLPIPRARAKAGAAEPSLGSLAAPPPSWPS